MGKLKNRFILIVPVFNGEDSIVKTLDSILSQDYEDLGIIIRDDMSKDNTPSVIMDYFGISSYGKSYFNFDGRDILCIRNDKKMYGGGNTYDSVINYVSNMESIIGVVDGDDFLLSQRALLKIDRIYNTQDKWLVWSQHKLKSGIYNDSLGYSSGLPPDSHIYSNRDYWAVSHFRTCKAWLYHQVDREDLMDPFVQDSFCKVSADAALLYPIIELCGNEKSFFLNEVLYMYNDELATNENKLYENDVALYTDYIRRSGKKYRKIDWQQHKEKVGLHSRLNSD